MEGQTKLVSTILNLLDERVCMRNNYYTCNLLAVAYLEQLYKNPQE